MVVQRRAKKVVKLFHISYTSLISDITKVKKIMEEIIKKKNKVSGGEHDGTVPEVNIPIPIKEDEDLNAVEDIKPDVVKIEEQEEDEDIFEDSDDKEIKPEQADYDSVEDEAEYDTIKNEEEVLEIESNQETDDENLNDEARVDDSSPLSDIENNDDESIGSDPLHGDVEHEEHDDVEHEEHGDAEHEEGVDEPQRKRSELEKLLIKSKTFWKDFNEMKKQGTVAEISSWVQSKDEHQFFTLPVNYMEMQYWEESEGAVFLL